MKCKICGAISEFSLKRRLLDKYDILYFRCPNCEFMQTEEPYWLEEAYKNPIGDTDEGILRRNIYLADKTERIIKKYFPLGSYLDYGGGYGIFTRLMRDRNIPFYHFDPLCTNLFAKEFTHEDPVLVSLLTSFEVLEHLPDPMKILEEMFKLAPSVLFTQELIPETNIEDWWYLGPQEGQHISFYDKKTLQYIANKFGKNLYSDGTLHIFTDLKVDPLKENFIYKARRKISNFIKP